MRLSFEERQALRAAISDARRSRAEDREADGTCFFCGVELLPIRHGRPDRKFCCRGHRNRYWMQTEKGREFTKVANARRNERRRKHGRAVAA